MIQLFLPENTAISPNMKGLQISVKMYLFLHHFSYFQGSVQSLELNKLLGCRTRVLLPRDESKGGKELSISYETKKHKDRPTSESPFPNWKKA